MTPTRRDRLCSLFEVIHTSSPGGAGALHFGDGPLGGVVLFDAGRVCWAAVPGTGRRLTDLVCEHGAISRREIESTYAECRERGIPLGETLVERKVVDAGQLRALLLRQTSETLVMLAECDAAPVWIPHRGVGYQPRFTFTLPEIAASTTAAGLAIDVTAARQELAATVVDGFGVAFDVHDDGRALPFAVIGDAESYDQVRALGDWVIEVWARWPSEAGPGFLVASTGAGGLVAWRAAGCLFGARADSSSGLVRALAHLMRRT